MSDSIDTGVGTKLGPGEDGSAWNCTPGKPIAVGRVVHEPDNSTTSHDRDDEFPDRTDDSDASVEKDRDGRAMLQRSQRGEKTVGVPFGRGDQGGMLGKAGFAAEG